MVHSRRKPCNKDRVSNLPDALIHHIFSFSEMKTVIQTSLLSSRWRYLWRSTQTLNFHLDERECDTSKLEECDCDICEAQFKRYTDFAYKVIVRRGNNSIFKLSVRYKFERDATSINRLINAALKRNAQEIVFDVIVMDEDSLEFPPELFASNVRDVKLLNYVRLEDIYLPNSICTASMIKDLELQGLVFPVGIIKNDELVLIFAVLENLTITDCYLSILKSLTISAPLLQDLKLSYLSCEKKRSCNVKTATPNLKILCVEQSFASIFSYSLGNLASLVTADIAIDSDIAKENKRECANCLINVLTRVYNVEDLRLSVSSIQLLTDFPELSENLPELLHNLKSVTLQAGFFSLDPHAILNFLGRFPHVETLVCQTRVLFGSSKEKWQPDLACQSFFYSLSTFEIQDFRNHENQLKFLELLLKRAINLKKAIIKTLRNYFSAEKLVGINEKLLSFPKASSCVLIIII